MPPAKTSRLRQFLKYAVPSVTSMWIFAIYTMVDGLFVAHGVGELALASVNLSMPFVSFIFATSLLFGMGTATVASIYLGQGEERKAQEAFSRTIVLLILISFVILALALLNLERLATLLGASEADGTMEYVKHYLGPIIVFNGSFLVSYAMEVLIKADGHPVLSTLGICAGAVTNIVLDAVFVLGLHWGIKGAAIATGLSQLVTAAIYMIHFLGKGARLRFVRFPLSPRTILRTMKVGVSDCVGELSLGFIVFLFNRAILMVSGAAGVVSFTVISYINNIVTPVMGGITQGMQPLVSFNHGRGDRQSCNAFLRLGVIAIAISSVVCFLVCVLGAPFLTGIFISPDNAEAYAHTITSLRLYSLTFLVGGFNLVLSGYFAAIEKPRNAMVLSISRGIVLITVCLAVMTFLMGETGIWLSSFVRELLCLLLAVFLLVRFRRSEDGSRAGASARSAECFE